MYVMREQRFSCFQVGLLRMSKLCVGHQERACCTLLAKEWQEHVAQAAVHSPGSGSVNVGRMVIVVFSS